MSAKALPLLSAVLVIGSANVVCDEYAQAQASTDVQIDCAALEGVTLTISGKNFKNHTFGKSTGADLCHSMLTGIVSPVAYGARS
jgi:hypothetical protein